MGLLDGIIGGILSPIGNVISSAIQSRSNAKVAALNTDKTNQANMELAKYAYSNDLNMWNKANEYNSPTSQMSRLKSAGLNPNMIYGNGASVSVGNTANSLPKYNAPTMRYDYLPSMNLPQMMSAFQDFKLKSAQIDNVKSNTDNNRLNAIYKGLQNMDQAAKNWFNFGNQNFQDENWAVHPRMTDAYESKKNLLGYQASVLKQTISDQVRKIQLANQTAESMIPKIKASTDYTTEMAKYQAKTNEWFNANNIARLFSLAARVR